MAFGTEDVLQDTTHEHDLANTSVRDKPQKEPYVNARAAHIAINAKRRNRSAHKGQRTNTCRMHWKLAMKRRRVRRLP